jgi:hypothetical protein
MFDPDGTPCMESASNMKDDLVALTSGQEPIPSKIEHRNCFKAHRTLGMWPTPDGSSPVQFEESLSKSKQFSVGINKASMTQHKAVTACWTMCIPSITCGLGSKFMDPDQLDTI